MNIFSTKNSYENFLAQTVFKQNVFSMKIGQFTVCASLYHTCSLLCGVVAGGQEVGWIRDTEAGAPEGAGIH